MLRNFRDSDAPRPQNRLGIHPLLKSDSPAAKKKQPSLKKCPETTNLLKLVHVFNK